MPAACKVCWELLLSRSSVRLSICLSVTPSHLHVHVFKVWVFIKITKLRLLVHQRVAHNSLTSNAPGLGQNVGFSRFGLCCRWLHPCFTNTYYLVQFCIHPSTFDRALKSNCEYDVLKILRQFYPCLSNIFLKCFEFMVKIDGCEYRKS